MCSDHTTQDTQHAVLASVLESGGIATERNRYFTGKYMSARDFADEQAYHISHQRLHNRLHHGAGVVCGMRVVPHPNAPHCKDWAVVRAGVAIDCRGRDLVLPEDTAIYLGDDLPPAAATGGGPAEEPTAAQPPPPPEPPAPGLAPKARWLVLCARYKDVPVECVPALYDEGLCDPTRREANRTREVTELKLYKLSAFAPFKDRWPGTEWHAVDEQGAKPKPQAGDQGCRGCRDDCDDNVPGPVGLCLEPACLLDDVVPLALIKPVLGDPDRLWVADMTGRPELAKPREFLTHIVGLNWTHGGPMTLSQLEANSGRLEVRFDRRLKPATDSTGINEFTFVVQYYEGGQQRDVEFLPYANDAPPTVDPDDPCLAVFTLDSDVYEPVRRGRSRETLPVNTRIYVTLKCDFILDCQDNPVDGNHLRGKLPSGDGIPGGTFESWFWIEDEPAEGGRSAERRRA